MRVTAALVDHPPVVPSFAYRFDSSDRSIVISASIASSAESATLRASKKSIMSHHTSAVDAGRVARDAGVKTLVLSHFVPAEDEAISDEMWVRAAKTDFDGEVVMGKDLLEL